MAEMPAWRRRYTAPRLDLPVWSLASPQRLFFLSSEGGSLQAWACDPATGTRRRLTNTAIGVERIAPLPDGSGLVWWFDATGDERGRWMVTPFEGGGAWPLIDGIPDGWSGGMSLARGVTAIALSDEEGCRVFLAKDGEEPRVVWRSEEPAGIGREWEFRGDGLSVEGGLLCVRSSEGGDIAHNSLRVIDVATGDAIGEQRDPGHNLMAGHWSPVPGDTRISFLHELEGIERPAIWDLATGERRNVALDLPGAVELAGWWPDGSALLLIHEWEGRRQLWRLDASSESGSAELIHDPGGWISDAAVRPDGEVWLRPESGSSPAVVRTVDGREILGAGEDPAPRGVPLRSFRVENPKGQSIHGFVATPEGDGPFPTVMLVHGGPDWAFHDSFLPWPQALVDHGYAVAMVNYRGSTGYGVRFREALVGNIGFPEIEDVVAALDALVADGTADPARVAIEGWSWGGYIALLAAGTHPDRWGAVIGGIPVADYIACHEDCSPPQRAWDMAMLGGGPDEKRELYEERSPITYVHRVRAPVLIIAGENDSACPIRQVNNYVDALRARGGDVRTHIYPAGHHANTVEENLLHAELELAFFDQHLHQPSRRRRSRPSG